jgi:hypothetical protein
VKRPNTRTLVLSGSLALAAGSGYIASVATGSSSQEPGRTVTINVGQAGPTGPAGPQGETGPAGLACPSGYAQGRLVFNAPQGQQAIWTCLAA